MSFHKCGQEGQNRGGTAGDGAEAAEEKCKTEEGIVETAEEQPEGKRGAQRGAAGASTEEAGAAAELENRRGITGGEPRPQRRCCRGKY
jgi:hypothetical protein